MIRIKCRGPFRQANTNLCNREFMKNKLKNMSYIFSIKINARYKSNRNLVF